MRHQERQSNCYRWGDEGAGTIKGCGILGGTLEQEKKLHRKPADIRVRSEV